MTIQVRHTAIPDVKLIEPHVFGDSRGAFLETFNQAEFEEKVARGYTFVQDNHSISAQGVLRGLHYQIQHPQGKLVRVVVGEVFDVAVDLRRWSSTFGRWVGVRLSASNRRQLWIPPGFAHGFVVLSDVAEFLYKATAFWHPEHERTLRWDDPDIAVEWELNGVPFVSSKDAAGSRFNEAEVY
ncbi:dTDP-4-dehydrorhamnose 3,5-epimerase [Paraburkholderia sediminicola]|uniref:dTDP-4-dehydrorhamnose 3,5-epimerase n=1 Tax=Paraburkholderia sediminicola TaxID=458836 RepID=UPI0038B6D193